jgi:hypothetical protein
MYRSVKVLKVNYKGNKKIRKVKKMLLINVRPTYDLSVRTEVGRKSTTKCSPLRSLVTGKDYSFLYHSQSLSIRRFKTYSLLYVYMKFSWGSS